MPEEVTTTEEQTQETAVAQPFRREIDLGDGSGVQVFEAETAEALIDKLTEAQRNATAKIRDLSRRARTTGSPELAAAPKPLQGRRLTVDEQAILAQEFQATPESAFEKMMRAGTGLTPEELRQEVQSWREERAATEAARQTEVFMAEYPDYEPTPENGEAMVDYLRSRNLAPTSRNFAIAFDDLSARGLLAREKPSEGRIATEEPKRETRPAHSGLSARDGRAARPQPVSEEAALAKMSTRDMEDYILRRYGGNR